MECFISKQDQKEQWLPWGFCFYALQETEPDNSRSGRLE